MLKNNQNVSQIKDFIKEVLVERASITAVAGQEEERIFSLSVLRAELFKASYSAREINATLSGFLRKGWMRISSDKENEPDYAFSKKSYS